MPDMSTGTQWRNVVRNGRLAAGPLAAMIDWSRTQALSRA